MNHDQYALYVTSMHSFPSITWNTKAVILVDNCVQLGQLCIVVRHDGGRAHFGPISEIGEPTEHDLLRGQILLDHLEHEVEEAMESRVIRAVPMSTLN